MKCHYEVLNVARDADITEIKSSYRKCALKWHPDKNPDNVDYAKEQFQLVQQAYEVLSDHQERAWYDKHREQILYGSNADYQDTTLDVFPYFTATCYRGYGDDERGFYTVYRTVFDRLIREDMEFIEDKEEFCLIPGFGESTSDYDRVVGPFYAYWMGYCTRKSYVWLDPYNIREMRMNRKCVKLAEKENKKVRMRAKKERNEEVRNLVMYVRKRDKRVQENSKRLRARVMENRRKQEDYNKQKRLDKQLLVNDSLDQAEWCKFDNVQSELEEIEKSLMEEFGDTNQYDSDRDNDDDQASEEFNNNLYCVACNKIFKTPKAFENHELSKKHKENVEKLRQIMLEEEDEDLEDRDDSSVESDDLVSEEETLVVTSENQKKKIRKLKNVLKVVEEHQETDLGEDKESLIDSDDLVSEGEEILVVSSGNQKNKKKKNRKSKNVLKVVEEHQENDLGEDKESLIDSDDLVSEEEEILVVSSGNQKNKKKKNRKSKNVLKVEEEQEEEGLEEVVELGKSGISKTVEESNDADDLLLGSTKKQKKKAGTTLRKSKGVKSKIDGDNSIVDSANNYDSMVESNKTVKKNRRKTKNDGRAGTEEIDTNHCCVTCKSTFPSKNKLFDHLKRVGHGVYLASKAKK